MWMRIISGSITAGKKESGVQSSTAGPTSTPKGCIAVRVGKEMQRFYVPVGYLNHPLFARLLKEAEEEYGFEQQGAITIPCHVEHFRHVRGMIDREAALAGGGGGGAHSNPHHNNNHPLHLHHLSGCFRA